jgi:hypothetical protein
VTIARLAPALPQVPGPIVERVPDGKANGDLKWALDEIKAKINLIRLRDNYYNGDHRLAYATKEWQTEFGKMLRAFNANYCPAVVDAVADRMRLIGVDISRGDNRDEAMVDRLERVWTANRMDRRSGQVHTAMLKHGEVYVTVWPHPRTEEVTYWVGRGDRIAVRYSTEDPDQIEMAAKIWIEGKRIRATLYYADHIERWATPEKSIYNGLPPSANPFEPLDEDWYTPHDYGVVPVVPFVNNPSEDGIGRSELDDVIPLQDALNIAMADMLVAMEFAAYPQRWAVGLIETRDPVTGKNTSPLTAGIERLWTSDDPNTKFGQFDVADMKNFVTAQDAIRADIARVSRTPINYLLMQGTAVSGEALRVMEAPLMSKVNDRNDTTSPAWETLARVSLIIDGAIRPDDRDLRLDARWRDTSVRGDLDHAKALVVKKSLGMSGRQALRELGYEEAVIDQMVEEAEAEAGDVAEAATRGFAQGRVTGF